MSRHRRLAVLLISCLPLCAQVWPEKWGEHSRAKAEPVIVKDAPLFAEYGGETAESAVYSGPAGKFRATAWKLKDATGAMGWFQALCPASAVPVRSQPLAATTPGALFLAEKNYVLQFEGWRPTPAELASLFPQLPKMRSGGGLPVFVTHLRSRGRIRNSERLIVGPVSLERFEGRIPGMLAGFEDAGEIATARYQAAGGEFTVALFNYPTQQIARQHAAGFEKQKGWVVSRSGPYVTVALEPGDPDLARNLISTIQYSANFSWNQATKALPIPPVGDMLVAIFQLTGLLLVAFVGGGVLFAVLRFFARQNDARITGSESPMTVLRIRE
jgi:hypothetical protein